NKYWQGLYGRWRGIVMQIFAVDFIVSVKAVAPGSRTGNQRQALNLNGWRWPSRVPALWQIGDRRAKWPGGSRGLRCTGPAEHEHKRENTGPALRDRASNYSQALRWP